MNRVINVTIMLAGILLAMVSLATAEVPQLINYQGHLVDASGIPLDTTVSMVFTIYNDAVGVITLWQETHNNVQVDSGGFGVLLGSVSHIEDNVFATDTVRWLGIKVGADDEIVPRTRLVSVPYAYQALRADTAEVVLSGGNSNWSVTGSVLYTNDYWGIARGGAGNVLNGDDTHTMINLGEACTTSEAWSTISGGKYNSASGEYSVIAGGVDNTASGNRAIIGGGSHNVASGLHTIVSGGEYQNANGGHSTIGGGGYNTANGHFSTIAGGFFNITSDNYSTVGGGAYDTATAYYSTVPGGSGNRASGRCSFAAGENAKALHDNTFVWSDGTEGRQDFASTAVNQVLFQAIGGFGIGTADPQAQLDVAGTIQGEAAFYFDENADLEDGVTDNAVIGFNYANPDAWSDRRLRITAGRDDGVANEQGACIDLHGNQRPQDTDLGGELHLVAGDAGGPILFYTGVASVAERMRIDSIGRVSIGTSTPQSRLTVNGFTRQVNDDDSTRSLIGITQQLGGGINTYGPNNKINVMLSNPVGDPNHGFVGVRDAVGEDSKVRMYVCPHSSGRITTHGANNTLNVNISHTDDINKGLISVNDGSGTEQAGMYVNTLGNGIVWGDEWSSRMANPDQPNTDIWYTSIEGPEAAAYIRGTAHLDNGKAEIAFPEHFKTVASPEGITIQLTPLSAESKGLAVVEKSLDGVVIRELSNGGGTYDFDYMVMAVRQGYEDYQVIRPSTEGRSTIVENGAEILLNQ